jgi:hypothetical protein
MAKASTKQRQTSMTTKVIKTPKSQRASTTPKKARSEKRERHYEGPLEWLSPMLEEAYTKLQPKEDFDAAAARKAPRKAKKKGEPPAFASTHQAGADESVLAQLPRSHWEDHLLEYRRRQRSARAKAAPRAGIAPRMPAIPGQNNWTPLGPSVMARGQTASRAAISGRVAGIAIAPGGARIYVAAANGGVWRSDDTGQTWLSTMDGFDVDPASVASASLVCGAIAIDPTAPDRIYVGTGEGDTDGIFSSRIVNALPAYRGIGPIRSDDGGATWVQEQSTPSLAGFSFFKIAVDPTDREHCVAATSNGLYERVPSGGGFAWARRRNGVHTSVVVARASGATGWFAAPLGGPVVQSSDGAAWATVGTGFPASVGRIALGVQPDNPNVLYALIATSAGGLDSVRRLNGMSGAWQNVAGGPPMLNGSQGDYDLSISVDPNNANLIYLGGDFFNADPFPGSIWRCAVSPSGTAFTMNTTSIGVNAHADVHVLVHSPGDSHTLWAGTDGGLFINIDPTGAGAFQSRNTGLATLCTNFISQHPLEPAVLFAGLQDNGTARCTGEEVWRHVLFADGGYCVVNWNDPFKVLLYANGNVFRATDGGQGYTIAPFSLGSWTDVTPAISSRIMASPLVGAPVNTPTPTEADVVALGSGNQVFISTNFGTSWPSVVALPSGSGSAFSMIFASATRLFVGTTNGHVFRLDRTGGGVTVTRLDNVAAGNLPLAGLVTDIAVDSSDATLNSIFICFGGTGDFRHVWRFNGTAWQARSGTAASGTELLDVEHNAIQFDRVTNKVYVGADIGAWESADGGNTWTPLSNGLPDAPVYDIQIHPTARLLRACLHGRGLFELKLDAPALADVELYIRDTVLDTGRGVNTDGRNDPSVFPTGPVVHYLSPNIKVDVPTPAGYQTSTTNIDFLTFNEIIVDGSNGVGTNSPPPTVHNRVYVEVHNRGRVDAANVQVMVALTNASAGLGLLPAGYTANVVAGTPLPGPDWSTLGVQTIPSLRAGAPRVLEFDLPSTVLPMPASLPGQSHYCLVAFLHSAQDAFTSTQRNVDLLTLAERKVGQKNLHIVEFVGTPPPPKAGPGIWAMLMLNGVFTETAELVDLVFDVRQFPGVLQVLLPPPLFPKDPKKEAKGFRIGSKTAVAKWQKIYVKAAERLFHEAKYPIDQYRLLAASMKKVAAQAPFVLNGGRLASISALQIATNDRHAIFLRIDPPAKAKPGSQWSFDVSQRNTKTRELLGGSRYHVVVNKKG